MEVVVGHACPKCKSTYIQTADKERMIISCITCGWVGPFSRLKKQKVRLR